MPAIPRESAIATSSDDEKATKANAQPSGARATRQPATTPSLAPGLAAPVGAAATVASVEPLNAAVPEQGGGAGLEMSADSSAVQDDELRQQAMRLKQTLKLALFIWSIFVVSDFVIIRYLAPDSSFVVLGCRAVGVVMMVLSNLLAHSKRPTRLKLKVASIMTFGTASIFLSVMAVVTGGVRSPFACAVFVVLVARLSTYADHWKETVGPVMIDALAYPMVFLLWAAGSPTFRAELFSESAMASFTHQVGLLLSCAGLMIYGSHGVWALRRQVYEARAIGRYKLTRKLGAGGMGEVWEAWHPTLRKRVAIKLLKRGDKGADPAAVARFEREVRATTELTHPNTVRIFDYGVTEDGLCFYAMEFLEGTDLSAYLKKRGRLPPAAAIHLIAQAARALGEAHARGITHRDIKPENIVVTSLGGDHDVVKLLDFGIAKSAATEGSKQEELTKAGMLWGTPRYMAPETVAKAHSDARSDVYALGCVLYQLLVGRPVFDRENEVELMMAHRDDAPDRPSKKLGQELPADLEAVVMRCLRKNADDRFQNAAELADALAQCADAGRWTRQLSDAQTFLAPPPKAAPTTAESEARTKPSRPVP